MKLTQITMAGAVLFLSLKTLAAQTNGSSTVTGNAANLLVKALIAAKVSASGSDGNLSLATRAIVCDVSPAPRAACVILQSQWFSLPLRVTGSTASDLFNALANAVALANPNESQCDSGLCSEQFQSVQCSGDATAGATCTLD